MRCLQKKLTFSGVKSLLFVSLMASAVLMLGAVLSSPMSKALVARTMAQAVPQAAAQQADCIPSFHRLLQNGQQLDVTRSVLSEFQDDTPIGDTLQTVRVDQVVLQEGFASIPLNSRIANGYARPRLRGAGTVYEQRFYYFTRATNTVWRVRNRSSQEKTVTLAAIDWVFDYWRFRWVQRFTPFFKQVVVPAYSDGFVLSPIVSRSARHVLIENNRLTALARPVRRAYRDNRTIEVGETRPLFEVLQEQGQVILPAPDAPSGISVQGVGIFAGEPQRAVFKITNGSNESQTLTLEANDSDFSNTLTVPANSAAYVVSEEDGCVDAANQAQEALWVAESEGLLKVLTESGDIAFELAISETINALSVSPIDRTIWVLTNNTRLEGFDANGQGIADNQFNFATPIDQMVVGSATVWLASDNQLQIATRNDTSQAINTIDFSEPILNIVYDSLRDQVLVILSNQVVSITNGGVQQTQIQDLGGSITAAAYDKRLDNVWLVSNRGSGLNDSTFVSRYSNSGKLLAEFDAGTDSAWSRAASDSNGGLWLANETDISHASRSAEIEFTVPAFSDLATNNTIVDIAAGSGDGSLWVANQTSLRQYDIAANLLKTLTPDLGDGLIRNLNHIDLETDLPLTLPSLTILAPDDGLVTSQVPEIQLEVSPSVSEADLDSLTFTNNGEPIAANCQPPVNNELVCSLGALNDGPHQISVTVNALDGTPSDPVSVSFVLDTIAPVITIDEPVDGLIVTEPNITVSGSVSEDATLTVRGNTVALDSDNRFSTELTLNEGLNSIFVTAIDAAGNQDTRAVMVVFNANQPPEITSQAVTTAKAENNYFYNVNATDPNGDELLYTLVNAPAGMTINPINGEINWLPATEGTAQVIVSVDDRRGGVDQQSFSITIAPANSAPSITSSPITESVVDSSYVYNVIATDPDGDTLVYRLLDAPAGLRINAQTGQITWQPFNAGISFVSVQVADPRGLTDIQNFTVQVSATDGLRAPVFNTIQDIVAPLGQTTRLTISAQDADGQELMYTLSPLPLPTGMTFNRFTGELVYRPREFGQTTLTFSVTDGRFTTRQEVQLTVPEPNGPTSLSGLVLQQTGEPLPGVRLEMGGIEVRSDQNGNFLLENLPGDGLQRLLVDGTTVDANLRLGTFPVVPEQIQIIQGASNSLASPIFLQPIDQASADPVESFQQSVITSSDIISNGVNYGPVILTIAPGTAHLIDNPNQAFNGLMSISRIVNSQAPQPLPDGLEPSLLISIQPFGVGFSQPAQISFPNIDGFEPGSILDIMGLNHDTGRFEVTGKAEVSSDGRRINSISGGIQNTSWHAPDPQASEFGGDSKGPQCDCNSKNTQVPTASSAGSSDGDYKDYHSIAPYYSLGKPRSLQLYYDTDRASPTPFIRQQTREQNRLPFPLFSEHQVSLGGELSTRPVIIQSRPRNSLTTFAQQAIAFDGRDLQTGLYRYQYSLRTSFSTATLASTVGQADRRGTVGRISSTNGVVPVVNYSDSPYGAGWGLDGISRLHKTTLTPAQIDPATINQPDTIADGAVSFPAREPGDEVILMDNGDGNHFVYWLGEDGNYISPNNDFVVFEKTANGFRRTTRSGMVKEFDNSGLLSEYRDRNGNTTTYAYDNLDRLISVTDPVGLVTTLSYIGDLLKTITDPAGRETRLEHDSQGNLISITDPDNSVKTYSYADNNIMSSKRDKRGFETQLEFDDNHRFMAATLPDSSTRTARSRDQMIVSSGGTMQEPAASAPAAEQQVATHVDENGNLTSYRYDANNYLAEVTDSIGRVTRTERDIDGNVTQLTRPNGSIVNSTYDDNGNVLSRTEAFNGARTEYEYDQFSLLTRMTDPLNRVTTTDRDTRGNMTRMENAEGHISTYDYDSRGLVTRMVDPNGLETVYEYNQAGLMVRKIETPPTGNVRVTTTQYNAVGLPESVTTPDGITQNIEYDNLNRPTRVQNQLGETQVNVYDTYGNVIESRVLNIDGTIATQETREYDERNRLIQTSRPHENGTFSVTAQEYDGNSNIVRITDPDGKVTQYSYDAEDRTSRMTQPDGGIVLYEYDTRDQITRVQSGNGAVTTYEYDVLTRKLAENSPDRGRWIWDYNIVNQVTRQTDERGVTTDYTYDLLDRPLTKTFPTASENVTYTYDNCAAGVGRLCERTDESGNHTYNYDFFGNVLQMSRTELGVLYTDSYVYDDGDNVIQCTYPTGRTVDFARDGIRRTNGITSNGSQIINSMTYRGDSQMISRSWNNGINETRAYDQQARLTQIGLGNIATRDYRYDASSNIISINSPFQTGSYGYDLNDRLTQQQLNGTEQISLIYDFNGNRLTELVDDAINDNQAETYRYQPQSNRLLNTEQTAPNGSTAQIENRAYSHNDADRIRSITVDDQQVAGTTTATYFYNDMGLRSRKTISNDAGELETTVYHYNMYGSLIAETSDTGQTQVEYIWNGMEPVAQIDPSGITSLHTDHLYTPRLGTDSTQTAVWQWESPAFGNAEPQVEATEVNLRFPGQYADEESGLYYNWNRYYDPETGRYVISDPIGLAGGLNTYGYAMANPNIYTDPTGEIVPALVACAVNPVCASAVRAGVGALIGGLSALAAAVNDPCFDGNLASVVSTGAAVGGFSSFVPGAGALSGAALRGGLAGVGGNTVGQIAANGGTDNFSFTQAGVAGVVGGASLAGGNIIGFNAALNAARSGSSTAQALAIGESAGSALGAAVDTSATLVEIGLNQNDGECGCGNQ